MKKRIAAVFLLMVMMLAATGCDDMLFSSEMTFMCVSNETSKSFSMGYEQFDGSKQYRMETMQNNTSVRVEVETESGMLDVKVTPADNKDEILYSAENLQSGSFSFEVKEAGMYTVTVTAEKHRGRFSFDWSK